jgi:type I site-specific restriction endonuclease
MQRYQLQVRVNGTWIKTVIFAENGLHARLLAQYQYGFNNAPFAPTKIG